MPCDDHRPVYCEVNGAYCVRAFCEDYGCADEAGVSIDANDIAAGSDDIDISAPMLPTSKRKRCRKNADQLKLI